MDSNSWIPKVGELIECVTDCAGYKSGGKLAFVKGKLYKVREFKRNSEFLGACSVLIEEDSLGSRENGWCLQHFKPASPAAQVLFTTKE